MPRLAERRLKMRRWEWSLYTPRQLHDALQAVEEERASTDPHAGGIEVASLDEAIRMAYGDDD